MTHDPVKATNSKPVTPDNTRRQNMPKKNGTGPPKGSGGRRDGSGGGKGNAPGKGTGRKSGGKKGKC